MKRNSTEKGYKDVYMISRIMAAAKAIVSSQSAIKTLFRGKFGISGAPAGVPLSGGAQASTESNTEAEVSTGESDFILAYRLRKITYLKTSRVKRMEDVKGKGTVLDDDAGAEEPEMEYEANFVRLKNKAIGSDEFELASIGARDEDDAEASEFVIPLGQQEEESDDEDEDED
jgi:hypothetical protein